MSARLLPLVARTINCASVRKSFRFSPGLSAQGKPNAGSSTVGDND